MFQDARTVRTKNRKTITSWFFPVGQDIETIVAEWIGHQIRRIDGGWWIELGATETKEGRLNERPIADLLTPHLDRWVAHWHTCFLDPGDALWPSTKGGMLAYSFVGKVITDVTRRELGVAVSPHLFRDSAVHTVAHNLGDQMGVAIALLQHTDPRTTELHYNKGACNRAAKKYVAIVTGRPARGSTVEARRREAPRSSA